MKCFIDGSFHYCLKNNTSFCKLEEMFYVIGWGENGGCGLPFSPLTKYKGVRKITTLVHMINQSINYTDVVGVILFEGEMND